MPGSVFYLGFKFCLKLLFISALLPKTLCASVAYIIYYISNWIRPPSVQNTLNQSGAHHVNFAAWDTFELWRKTKQNVDFFRVSLTIHNFYWLAKRRWTIFCYFLNINHHMTNYKALTCCYSIRQLGYNHTVPLIICNLWGHLGVDCVALIFYLREGSSPATWGTPGINRALI